MPGAYPGQAPRSGNRELRIMLGILCILGGLISGAGAIIWRCWVTEWPRCPYA